MQAIVRIIAVEQLTHDVKSFSVERPAGYSFVPGQATDLSINKPGVEENTRPFTFTSLPGDPQLQFTIKRYADHHGVTDMLHKLQPGDELIIRDSWGAIEYKGPGYFIAGGAGITPFLSILRQLHKEDRAAGNMLFYSNKTAADIICREELKKILAGNATFIVTRETDPKYLHAHIDEAFLQAHISDFNQRFYICGPDEMVASISTVLDKLGATSDAVIFEK